MDTIANKPNQTLRYVLVAGAVALLGIWVWAWMPAVEAWNDPSDGGFSAIPGVMATFTLLPIGVFSLFNALRGRASDLKDARVALIVAAVMIAVVGGVELSGNISEAQNATRL